MTAIINHRI